MDFEKDINDKKRAMLHQGRRPPEMHIEPRCKVCTHPNRAWIEMLILRGASYSSIEATIPPAAEGEETISRKSFANHAAKHMSHEKIAYREIIEREANLQGMNQNQGAQNIITARGVLEIMIRKGYEHLLDEKTTVEARDLIQLAKIMGDMDSKKYEIGLDELRSQFDIFLQAIKETCDNDTRNAISERVAEIRKRANIAGEYEKSLTPQDDEVIDAEIVPEDRIPRPR